MSLTDTAIRRAATRSKPYKMFDSGGLFMIVTPSGGKWWRFKFRYAGKEKLLSLGTYPDISLKDARERRDQERKKLAERIDPAANRAATKAAWAGTLIAGLHLGSLLQPYDRCLWRKSRRDRADRRAHKQHVCR